MNETNLLRIQGRKIRDRVKRHFLTPPPFRAEKVRNVVMGTTFSLTLAELSCYLILLDNTKSGEIPSYVIDILIATISGLEIFASTSISWLGCRRRRNIILVWLTLSTAVVFLLLFLPSSAKPDVSDFCTPNSTLTSAGFTVWTGVRIAMISVIGVVCSLARIAIWSHGLAYIDEALGHIGMCKHFGIIVMGRVLAIMLGWKIVMNVVTTLWIHVLMINGPNIQNIILMFWYSEPAENIKTQGNRGFHESFVRVITNKLAVALMFSGSIMVTALWGFSFFETSYMKTKYHMEEVRNEMSGFSDMARIVVVVLAIVLYGYKYTEPMMPRFNRFLALKKTAALGFFAMLLYLLITFLVRCDKGAIVGLNENQYVQPECSSTCRCDNLMVGFNPVCVVEEMRTYYSPCHAGCSSKSNINGIDVLSDCSCASGNNTVLFGSCTERLCHGSVVLHKLLHSLLITVTVLSLQFHGTVMMHVVDPRDTSLALGVALAVHCLVTYVGDHLFYICLNILTCAWNENWTCLLHKSSFPTVVGTVSAGLALFSMFVSSAIVCILKKNETRNKISSESVELNSL